jgi:hypothetical protein
LSHKICRVPGIGTTLEGLKIFRYSIIDRLSTNENFYKYILIIWFLS